MIMHISISKLKSVLFALLVALVLPINLNAQKVVHKTKKSPTSVNKPKTEVKKQNKTSNTQIRKNTTVKKTNKNVNINVNKNVNVRNTRVRRSPVRYTRAPHRHGGYNYFCHRPYHYHRYRPYHWGSYYHPWGFFVATLATTAIVVAIIDDSNNKEEYHYDNGTYYLKTEDGFVAVQAPEGAQITSIPKEAEKVEVGDTYNYYYGGDFYEQNKEGYIVVPATAGTIVPNLPEGGEEVKLGEQTYVKFGETYYQPIELDGKDMYEIVDVVKE